MSWEEEIKKNDKDNDAYKTTLYILLDEFHDESLEAGQTLKRILEHMVKFDKGEALDEIRPFVIKYNEALLLLDKYYEQVANKRNQPESFDEDEWRRDMT